MVERFGVPFQRAQAARSHADRFVANGFVV
jgi:hypothetical protein